MKIAITEADIQGGVRRDASNCAVAQALRRAGVLHAGVAGTLVLLANGMQHQYVVLPGKVQEWIAEFDAGGNTQPMEFELSLPDWAARATQRHELPNRAVTCSNPSPPFASRVGRRWAGCGRFRAGELDRVALNA